MNKVRCISNKGFERWIEVGKIYHVVSSNIEYIHIRLSDYKDGQFPPELFMKV